MRFWHCQSDPSKRCTKQVKVGSFVHRFVVHQFVFYPSQGDGVALVERNNHLFWLYFKPSLVHAVRDANLNTTEGVLRARWTEAVLEPADPESVAEFERILKEGSI